MVVKKYGNRRLYDTDASRYITLEELAGIIRRGKDVQVVDAKSGADLTQATLAQIILESRGASRLLPVPLLMQLIRMGDDALAEFFQRYVGWALQVYVQLKQNASVLGSFNPFASMGFGGGSPYGSPFGGAPAPPTPQTPPEAAAASEQDTAREEVAELRREIEELRDVLRESAGKKKSK